MRTAFERPLGVRSLVVVSAAVGLLLALTTLDLVYVFGGAAYWDPPWDDSAQSLAGLWAFVQDRWRFPLLSIGTYGVPEGANAANLNTVPLVSVILKLVYPLTHRVFVFFGAWVALCRILHAVFGALLLSELGERRLLPVVTISLIYASLPSLLERIPHADLSAQFFLPASLILYLRVVRAGSIRKLSCIAYGLMLAALLVHPYLLVMAFLPYAAALGERFRRGLTGALPAAGLIAAQLCGLLVPMLACGYLDAADSPWLHYGEWSLNLLSPFLLAEGTLLPAASVLASTECLPTEGINYLGLGAIGLLLVASAGAPRDFFRPLRRHLVLCGVLGGLTVFALSNRVYMGQLLLFSYSLPPLVLRLANVFRASGRFFWPVGVALIAWCVVVVARRLPAGAGTLALALACGVQWLDLSGARDRSLRRSSRNDVDALGDARAAWSGLVARHHAIEVYPSYACGDYEENEFDLQLQLLAVRAGVPINSAYLSRPNKDCERERRQGQLALHVPPEPGVLRIFYRRQQQPPPEAAWAGDPEACRVFDGGLGGIVCTTAWPAFSKLPNATRGFRQFPASQGAP